MWMLALDSSTEWCSVAVGDGRRWHGRDEHVGQSHSERLLPLARTMLAEAGLALSQLDGIAFGAGPGSFTGIRIGCGVAQGLALGADLPVVAVPTLEALAQEARREHGWDIVVACLDARMREVYAAMYAYTKVATAEVATGIAASRAWRALMEPIAIPPATLRLPSNTGELYGAGNGYAAFPSLAMDLGLTAVDQRIRPAAQSIGELALPRLSAGDAVAAAQALPLYVRHRVALTTAEREAGVRL
jgi:tRNA threonylcarbamoyladenosine biosynthesis protein TsaB